MSKEIEQENQNEKKPDEKQVEVMLGAVKEMKEILTEAKKLNEENLAKRKKAVYLTESVKSQFSLDQTLKNAEVIKFLQAIGNRDTKTLEEMDKNIAEKTFGSYTAYKALNEGTGNEGGYLVPEEFERDVIRFMNDYSEIRMNALVLPMTSDTKRLNSLTGNVTVYYKDELGTVTGSQNTFGEPVLTARKIIGLTDWSSELAEDEENSLLDIIKQDFAEEIAQKEQNEFVNGIVSGSEGLLKVAGVTNIPLISGTTFSDLTFNDLAGMNASLFGIEKEAAKKKAKYYMSMTAYNVLRTQQTTDKAYILPIVPSQEAPAMAWGKEIVVLNEFPTSTATGTKFVVHSDLKKHAVIGDRRGLTMKLFDAGTVIDSGGSSRNLITTDAAALRVTKRTAFTTVLQSGIVTLSTN